MEEYRKIYQLRVALSVVILSENEEGKMKGVDGRTWALLFDFCRIKNKAMAIDY